jgi:hypothetical protein
MVEKVVIFPDIMIDYLDNTDIISLMYSSDMDTMKLRLSFLTTRK